ncbi:MAG: hypothetical protein M1383_05550 [Patescibacteria group bacterium]|nr:hypothetical protein [Patescibacteria group bacterium]
MELTREYLDKQLAKLATKDNLTNLATKDELRNLATKDELRNLATKDDLKQQTKELKEFAEEQTEALARIISNTVAEPMERHFSQANFKIDAIRRINELEGDMGDVKAKLHLV